MKALKLVAALVCVAVAYTSCTKNNDVKPSNAANHFIGKVAVDTTKGDQPPIPPK